LELLFDLVIDLSLQDIFSFGLLSKYFQENIDQNQYFWKLKFARICTSQPPVTEDWKWACFRFGRIRQYNYDGTYRMIPSLRAKQISSSHDHTLCLDLEGRVWGWGSAEFGKLPEETRDPILLSEMKSIKVVANRNVSYFLTEKGVLYYIGVSPSAGVSTKGEIRSLPFPIPIRDFSAAEGLLYLIDGKGILWAYSFARAYNPVLPALAKRVFSSPYYDGVILQDGNAWHIARYHGRIGLYPSDSPVKEVGFSIEHTVYILENGQFIFMDLVGLVSVIGYGAHSMAVGTDDIYIWNSLGDLIYPYTNDLQLSNIHQIGLSDNGVDLIFSAKMV